MIEQIRDIQRWAHLLEIAAWTVLIGIPFIVIGLTYIFVRLNGISDQLQDIQNKLTVLDEMDAEE